MDLKSLLELVKARGFDLDTFIADGKNHRFKVADDDQKRSGSYRVFKTKFGSEVQITNFKDPDSNLKFRLSDLGRDLTEEELELHEKEIEQKASHAEARRQILWNTVALQSEDLWRKSKADRSHPKLLSRKLEGSFGTRVLGRSLLVPCRDIEGKLWSLQSLYENSKGYFPYGSRQKGCFHLIGEVDEELPLFITEGFVTGASLHQLSSERFPVAVAFSANNLTDVALAFRKTYPKLEIIVSGDRDAAGIKNSHKAAKLAKARVLIPDFGSDYPDFKDWNDFYKTDWGGFPLLEGGVSMGVTQIESYRQKSQSGDFETWFSEWIKKNQLEMTYKGEFSLGEARYSMDYIEAKLFLDANQSSKAFGKNHCRSVLQMWMEIERRRLREAIISPLFETKINRETNRELEKFVHAITSTSVPSSIAALKHFIWQVKRKLLRLPVKDQMMLVLTGPQRSGKTRAIAELVKPLKELVGTKSVSSLTDERQYPMYGEFYVIVCDEMARSEQASIDLLKHIITSSELQTKKYYSQTQLSIRNNSTLIGSSNYPIETLLKDPTGMRRFVEIETEKVCNWDAINEIDYEALWQSVDEKAPSSILPFLRELSDAQEEYRQRTDVEEWADEIKLRSIEDGKILLKDLWAKSYKIWCEQNGVKLVRQPQGFGLELKRLGYRTCRSDGKRFLRAYAEGFSNHF